MFDMVARKFKSGANRVGSPHAFRLLQREDGAAAVEFALVVAPFLAMLFAIMETALVFFAGQTLETAAADSARLILTGQAQTGGVSQSSFKTDKVCPLIYGIFDCANIGVDVQTYASFAQANMSKPVDAQGNLLNNYQTGGPCAIVVARLLYQFPVYVDLLGFNLSDMGGGKRLLVATSVFRNEPYAGTC